MNSGAPPKAPWLRYAFHNIYNYTFLGGIGSAALLNHNWWLAVLGGGLEVVWLLFAPDSRLLQKHWFLPMHEEAQAAQQQAAWLQRVHALPDDRAARVLELQRLHDQILKMGGENDAVSGEMLQRELHKLRQILLSFADLMALCDRLERYLRNADLRSLEEEMRRLTAQVERPESPETRALAQKNLAVLSKRRDKLAEIKQCISRSQAQMDLIENTFELLADQVVNMRSPQEFSSQLDDLVDGVEAVRSTARETSALLEGAGR